MKIKLCGFSEEESLKTAINCGCDFIGFVFYDKSERNISIRKAKEISKIIPTTIAKVAVVVSPNQGFLSEIVDEFKPDYVQFHGQESVEYLEKFKQNFPEIKIIKALAIKEKQDLDDVKNFEEIADLFLFDNISGGSGKVFDWNLLKNLNTNKEWFLSGGINVSNVKEAVKKTGAKMIDVSSGIESSKGVKSSKIITDFIREII